MKKQNEISHPVAVRVINDLLELLPEKKRGTYNIADPTMYSSGGSFMNGGLYVSYHDCTWGVEITVSGVRMGHAGTLVPGMNLAEIYLSREQKLAKGKWEYVDVLTPRKLWNNGWFKILRQVVKLNQPDADAVFLSKTAYADAMENFLISKAIDRQIKKLKKRYLSVKGFSEWHEVILEHVGVLSELKIPFAQHERITADDMPYVM